MTNRQKIIKTKAGILEPARQSGNVSQACKATGHSRDSFYRFKAMYETGGEAALAEISGQKPNEKNRADPIVEQAAADFAYEQPAYGQLRASNELKKQDMPVSPGGVRSGWLRHDMAAFKGRLRALEAKTARENLMPAESRLAALERLAWKGRVTHDGACPPSPPPFCRKTYRLRDIPNAAKWRHRPLYANRQDPRRRAAWHDHCAALTAA